MNIRNVLSTYKKLRDLTDDETALLETLPNPPLRCNRRL